MVRIVFSVEFAGFPGTVDPAPRVEHQQVEDAVDVGLGQQVGDLRGDGGQVDDRPFAQRLERTTHVGERTERGGLNG